MTDFILKVPVKGSDWQFQPRKDWAHHDLDFSFSFSIPVTGRTENGH